MSDDIPLSRLDFFRKEIGLDETKLAAIRPYAAKLAARAPVVGKYLDALFRRVTPTAVLDIYLEYFDGSLADFWSRWYSTLWDRAWDEDFLRELWLQGVRAAKIGIDLQYVMLAEIKSRQLFLGAVREEAPLDRRGPVVLAVNDLLDLCMMVRAKGHVNYHTQYAEPLLQGLFHQTRNPLTVIGGTAMRLMRAADPSSRDMAQVILDEALRLERMTRDISTFHGVETRDPVLVAVALAPLVQEAFEALGSAPTAPAGLRFNVELDPAHPEMEADPELVRLLLHQVLQNAVEALPTGGGEIAVRSGVDAATPSHLSVSVLGPGELPRSDDVETLFLPFHSSKPQGTGFGLPIALAAARKCQGTVTLSQTPQGVLCVFKLPLKGRIPAPGQHARREP